jgi:hypothetical protein
MRVDVAGYDKERVGARAPWTEGITSRRRIDETDLFLP